MKFIKGFDSLRGISILLVLLTHLGLYELLPSNEYLRKRVWLLFSGLTGVQIFFSLSGFLITNILLRERLTTGTIKPALFFAKRFIRLIPPLLIFYILILVAMWLKLIPFNKIGLILSVFYLYNFIPNFLYSGELGHTWSLAVEEQFYLIWPFLLLITQRLGTIITIILFVIILCICGTYLLPAASLTYKGYSYNLGGTFKLERWFIPACAPIMIGSLFSLCINYFGNKIEAFMKGNHWVPGFSAFFFVAPLYMPAELLPIISIFQAAGISAFLTWIYFNQLSVIVSQLDNKILNYIGKISYGLYVYQGFFLKTGPGGILWLQQFPVNIICAFSLAVLSYEFIEKRCLKYKKYFQVLTKH